MALIEDCDNFAKDFLNDENKVSSDPSPKEDDNEIIQVSDEEIDVIMDEEPFFIEIEELLSVNLEFVDENELNQTSGISEDEVYLS